MFHPLDTLLDKPGTSRVAMAMGTGARSGIGAASAVELAHRAGAVVCRNVESLVSRVLAGRPAHSVAAGRQPSAR